MTETVVHVTTLEEWKSVLDVWFEQGYKWFVFEKGDYLEDVFTGSSHYLILDDFIYQNPKNDCKSFIEYSEFMAQQKEDKEMETYYVTQEQLDLIKDLKEGDWPLSRLVNSQNIFRPLNEGLKMIEEKSLLRYLGGDETIEFKVKDPLYRLWRIDGDNDKIYMRIDRLGTPNWTPRTFDAFTAPEEEIKKWETPAWEIEKVDD